MPVAIRKRSWEDHVTHPSGLQYSYDDLDLVCCHGVGSEGSWVTNGVKHGRRIRCASMPEGYHQGPTDVIVQTLEVAASMGCDGNDSKPLTLIEINGDVQCCLQEESKVSVDVDISKRASESKRIQTTDFQFSGEFDTDPNSRIPRTNITCATDSKCCGDKTDIGDVGTESRPGDDLSNEENVFKNPYMYCKEQQCITICSNNEPSLCVSAGEQPGNSPNQQKTKDSATEGYSRAPQPSEATPNQTSQTDLPHVEDWNHSACFDGATLPVDVLRSSVIMENGYVLPRANQTVYAVVMPVAEEKRDKRLSEGWRTDSADGQDGLNDPGHLIGNKDHSLTGSQAGALDHQKSSDPLAEPPVGEISNQMSLQQHTAKMNRPEEGKSEECRQAETTDSVVFSDILAKGEKDINVTLSVQQNSGSLKEELTQTNTTLCADQCLLTMSNTESEEIPAECIQSKMANQMFKDQPTPHDLEKSCSKLDTIPEVTFVEADGKAQQNLGLNLTADKPSPNGLGEVSEKQNQNLQMSFVEVSDEASSADLRGNQASGHPRCDSPDCEVADGRREHHKPQYITSVSTMEEAAQTANSDTHSAGPVTDETKEIGNQKEDGMVKGRMRKVSHQY